MDFTIENVYFDKKLKFMQGLWKFRPQIDFILDDPTKTNHISSLSGNANELVHVAVFVKSECNRAGSKTKIFFSEVI